MMPPNSNDCDCGICNYCNGVHLAEPTKVVGTHLGLSHEQWVELEQGIAQIINRMSLESRCGDIPDFILAGYLTDCLANLIRGQERIMKWRES